ncbi:hypothetical protein HNQ59_000977 [Chitinivorax tropicus]|uniref:Dicarboxylate transport domain-containing protein n=2 Tax=Chitinivorax tropicus TaxID=714531 RepID=A0A840MGD8_9PROT|nr:hypothetical protein [Chitinivorax tropicus]
MAVTAQAATLSMDIKGLSHPAVGMSDVTATLTMQDKVVLDARIGDLHWQGHQHQNVRYHCPDLQMTKQRLRCEKGQLLLPKPVPVALDYWPQAKRFKLELQPPGEYWRVEGQLSGRSPKIDIQLQQADLSRLSPLLPHDGPMITNGRASGQVQIRLDQQAVTAVSGQLAIQQLVFADQTGLHAGDKLAGQLSWVAQRAGEQWQWQGQLDWQQGEVFWNPMYFPRGGHQLIAQGVWSPAGLSVDQAKLNMADIGRASLSLAWSTAQGVERLSLTGQSLSLAQAYGVLLKPWLAGTAAADLEVTGEGDIDLSMRDGALQSLDIALRKADLIDNQQRFALKQVGLTLPWRVDQPTLAELSFDGGHLLKVDIGATRVPLRLNGWDVEVKQASLPILDGRLDLQDFHAAKVAGNWQWAFSGALAPISMPRFSTAMGWPSMKGTLSGKVPRVSFHDQILSMDGTLQMKVFDGTIELAKLKLINPLGVPSLTADLTAHELDLGMLTETFSFGSIAGKVDASVQGLELSNWQPLRFDAKLMSSAGSYPRRISQRAVQNISALGGGGAAVALQKSVLRIFENFRYSQLGLSCRLHNGVCTMTGVEPAPGGYVIVKGGGVPAITVMGYNRQVDWDELIERLKRITRDNLKPVVQ